MDNKEKALKCHEEWNGKLETIAKSKVNSREDLAIAYTPGVAEPCKIIAEDKEAAYKYTWKANTVAVVSDGSAVLGLGNIGPYAAMPVMEGKCVLFKEFGNVNAVPICLDTQDTEEIIAAVKNIAPGFGGINLEDISAPRCFEIEERLKEMLDIPVFHDDQHGTAIVVLAGIINSLRLTGKKKEDCKVVVNGAGSAGVAITKLLLTYGFTHVTMCDRLGIIGKDYPNLNWMQQKMTEVTNLENAKGTLADALKGADIFVGVSAPNIVTAEMVSSMNKDAILFAMANPVLIKYLNDVKYSFNSYTMDRITIEAATAAVKDRAYFEETTAKVIKTREWTKEELKRLGFTFCDSKSNFIFAKPANVSATKLFEDLKADNIFVRHFSSPERINDYLRISIGTDEQMHTLIKFLENYSC